MKSPGGTLATGGLGATRTRSMLWPGASWATESAIPTPAATVASAAHRTAKEASRWVFGPCKGAPRRRSSGGRRRCRVEASAGAGGGARCVPRGSAFSRSPRCGSAGRSWRRAGAALVTLARATSQRRPPERAIRMRTPETDWAAACRPEAAGGGGGGVEAAEVEAEEAEAAAGETPAPRRQLPGMLWRGTRAVVGERSDGLANVCLNVALGSSGPESNPGEVEVTVCS